jgi:thioester reductase-like protein
MGIHFITGGTGHLGTSLVHWLLRKDNSVALLVRPDSLKRLHGKQGLVKLIEKSGPGISSERINRRLRIVGGDITKPKLGLGQADYKKLTGEVTTIYHSAALLDFMAPWEALQTTNIEGTRNLLDFGMACTGRAAFQGVCHISTFAVAGTATGTFYEKTLDVGQKFNNDYERSKFEGEKLVATYRQKGLPISVFRPSIIVGNSKTGETRSFETLYKPLHFLSLGLYDQLPANGRTKFNLVPVDSTAEAIYKIVDQAGISNRTYHIVNSHEINIQFLIQVASRVFGFQEPALIPAVQFDYSQLQGFRRKLLFPYLPYLNRDDTHWDSTEVQAALKNTSFDWPVMDEAMLEKLFRYCIAVGYIRTPENGPTAVLV